MVQRLLNNIRSTLQATLINNLLQICRKAIRIDSRKQVTTDFAMRQYVDKLLQPEGLFPFEGSAVIFVRGDIQQ